MAFETLQKDVKELAEHTGAEGYLNRLDEDSRAHSGRVSNASYYVARSLLGLSRETAVDIAFDGLLHDVGKIIPEISEIIRSKDKLTPETRRIVDLHSSVGALMLVDLAEMQNDSEDQNRLLRASDVARDHHKPVHLLVGQNKLATSIVAVADVTDSTCGPRRVYQSEEVYSQLVARSNEKVAEDLGRVTGYTSIGVFPLAWVVGSIRDLNPSLLIAA